MFSRLNLYIYWTPKHRSKLALREHEVRASARVGCLPLASSDTRGVSMERGRGPGSKPSIRRLRRLERACFGIGAALLVLFAGARLHSAVSRNFELASFDQAKAALADATTEITLDQSPLGRRQDRQVRREPAPGLRAAAGSSPDSPARNRGSGAARRRRAHPQSCGRRHPGHRSPGRARQCRHRRTPRRLLPRPQGHRDGRPSPARDPDRQPGVSGDLDPDRGPGGRRGVGAHRGIGADAGDLLPVLFRRQRSAAFHRTGRGPVPALAAEGRQNR